MIKSIYRWIADHLTKWLGILGATVLTADSVGYLEGVKAAALQYLPDTIAVQLGKHIGIVLFILVIVRGWYTGWKAKQTPAILPPPVSR
jgi:hypothetical protein